MNNILIDSSLLYVMLNTHHKDHQKVKHIAKIYHNRIVIPHVVLTEVAFLFNREAGTSAVVRFMDALIAGNYHYEILLPQDFIRIRQIMMQYHDAKFDFVDCCLMALSERLMIDQIGTLDKRDFSIFRPTHVPRLDLLP